MKQNKKDIEARLSRLEKEMAELKSAMAVPSKVPWFQEIVGIFEGDEAFAEIMRLGRLYRQGKLKE